MGISSPVAVSPDRGADCYRHRVCSAPLWQFSGWGSCIINKNAQRPRLLIAVTGLPAAILLLGQLPFGLDEEPGALDDRHVDHLAADSDSADPFGERLVVGGDDAAGVLDLPR
jgi:hypothetical protein